MAILFYDADCGFCQASVDWLLKDIEIKLSTIPYQNIEQVKQYPIDLSIADDEIQLLDNGNVYSGAEAIAICLNKKNNILYKFIGCFIKSFFILPLAKYVYKIIASNRTTISKILGLNSCKIK